MPIAFFARALHRRVWRARAWARIRFFAVFGQRGRDSWLVRANHHIRDAVIRWRAEVGMQMDVRADAFDVFGGVRIDWGVGDFLVERIVGREDRARALMWLT